MANLLLAAFGIIGLLGIIVLIRSLPLKVLLAFGWLFIWLWIYVTFVA
ncbi:MAG TPA: hypothetical protein VMW61_04590 [Dehalococcoidales bacterium]|nr:hypothetical protein [Dehalococcoidales bacterium]